MLLINLMTNDYIVLSQIKNSKVMTLVIPKAFYGEALR